MAVSLLSLAAQRYYAVSKVCFLKKLRELLEGDVEDLASVIVSGPRAVGSHIHELERELVSRSKIPRHESGGHFVQESRKPDRLRWRLQLKLPALTQSRHDLATQGQLMNIKDNINIHC